MEDYNTEIKVEHKQSESQRAMNSMQGTIVCVVIFGVIAYLVSYIYKYKFNSSVGNLSINSFGSCSFNS